MFNRVLGGLRQVVSQLRPTGEKAPPEEVDFAEIEIEPTANAAAGSNPQSRWEDQAELAQDDMSEAETRFQRQVFVLSLSALRTALSDRWYRFRPKIMMITEGVISAHLKPGDTYGPCGEDGFSLFLKGTGDEGRLRLFNITGELGRRLVGENFHGGARPQIMFAEVDEADILDENGNPDPQALQAAILSDDIVWQESASVSDHSGPRYLDGQVEIGPDGRPVAYGVTANTARHSGDDPGWQVLNRKVTAETEFTFTAIWQAKGQNLGHYRVNASDLTGQELVLAVLANHQDAKISGIKPSIVVSMSFDEAMNLEPNLWPRASDRLSIEITGATFNSDALAALALKLRGDVLHLILRLELSQALGQTNLNFSQIARFGFDGVAVDFAPLSGKDEARLALLKFCQSAIRAQLLPVVWNITQRSLLADAAKAPQIWVSGSALMRDLPQLGRVVPAPASALIGPNK